MCRSGVQARLGTAAALLADCRRAGAAFGRARNIFTVTESVPWSRWLGFYGTADLHSLHSLHGKSLRRTALVTGSPFLESPVLCPVESGFGGGGGLVFIGRSRRFFWSDGRMLTSL